MSQTAKSFWQLLCLIGGLYCMHDANIVGGLLGLYGIIITHLYKPQPKQKQANPEWQQFINDIDQK